MKPKTMNDEEEDYQICTDTMNHNLVPARMIMLFIYMMSDILLFCYIMSDILLFCYMISDI